VRELAHSVVVKVARQGVPGSAEAPRAATLLAQQHPSPRARAWRARTARGLSTAWTTSSASYLPPNPDFHCQRSFTSSPPVWSEFSSTTFLHRPLKVYGCPQAGAVTGEGEAYEMSLYADVCLLRGRSFLPFLCRNREPNVDSNACSATASARVGHSLNDGRWTRVCVPTFGFCGGVAFRLRKHCLLQPGLGRTVGARGAEQPHG